MSLKFNAPLPLQEFQPAISTNPANEAAAVPVKKRGSVATKPLSSFKQSLTTLRKKTLGRSASQLHIAPQSSHPDVPQGRLSRSESNAVSPSPKYVAYPGAAAPKSLEGWNRVRTPTSPDRQHARALDTLPTGSEGRPAVEVVHKPAAPVTPVVLPLLISVVEETTPEVTHQMPSELLPGTKSQGNRDRSEHFLSESEAALLQIMEEVAGDDSLSPGTSFGTSAMEARMEVKRMVDGADVGKTSAGTKVGNTTNKKLEVTPNNSPAPVASRTVVKASESQLVFKDDNDLEAMLEGIMNYKTPTNADQNAPCDEMDTTEFDDILGVLQKLSVL